MKVLARVTIAAFALLALATPAAAQSEKKIDLRGQFGGVFIGGDTGFILGAGIGARPFNNPQVETTGDFSLLRIDGGNGVYVSGNVFYHFKTSEPNFKPFAGGGLGIVSIFDNTQARLQVGGGIEINAASKHPIRPELRFVFTEHDTMTIILVSIGLGGR